MFKGCGPRWGSRHEAAKDYKAKHLPRPWKSACLSNKTNTQWTLQCMSRQQGSRLSFITFANLQPRESHGIPASSTTGLWLQLWRKKKTKTKKICEICHYYNLYTFVQKEIIIFLKSEVLLLVYCWSIKRIHTLIVWQSTVSFLVKKKMNISENLIKILGLPLRTPHHCIHPNEDDVELS